MLSIPVNVDSSPLVKTSVDDELIVVSVDPYRLYIKESMAMREDAMMVS